MKAQADHNNLTWHPPLNSRRNRLAWRIANWALNHVATEKYRILIEGAIRLGLETAAQPYPPSHEKARRLLAEAREADRQADFNFHSPHANSLIIDRNRREAEQKRLEAKLILSMGGK